MRQVKQETRTVYVSIGAYGRKRAMLTKRAAYRRTAWGMIREREQEERFLRYMDDPHRLAARLARWLEWRDAR
mgnify:CR=1 FL=1|jgi:hypothetical protein